MSDVRYALRTLRRNAGSTFIAVLLLALGIGTNTLIFSAINVIELRLLPVKRPEQLVQFNITVLANPVNPQDTFSLRAYTSVRGNVKSLAAVFAQAELRLPLENAGSNEEVPVSLATGNFFSELGVEARYGRTLTAEDDSETAIGAMPAVISDSFWRQHFDSDRRALGQTLRLMNHPFQVVGILPEDFNGIRIDSTSDIWIPSRAIRFLPSPNPNPFETYGRLASGVSLEQAEADVFHAYDPWHGEDVSKKFRFRLVPISKGNSLLRKQWSQPLTLLISATGILLLLVCANSSGLLLARAAAQEKSIAIRLAVGASRWRIARQLFAETLLLVLAGGALGLALTYGGAPWLERAIPPLWIIPEMRMPIVLHLTPDRSVFAFTLGLCALAALLAGLIPALSGSRTRLNSVLKSGSARPSLGSFLVFIQVALASMLLLSTMLLTRTFANLHNLNPGFDKDHVVTFSVDPQAGGYSPEASIQFVKDLVAGVKATPGVRDAAIAARGMMRGRALVARIARTSQAIPKTPNTTFNEVTAHYLGAMGLRILEGRDFAPSDIGPIRPTPVVVNQAFVKSYFTGESPIGGVFGSGLITGFVMSENALAQSDFKIIGVVNNAKYRSMREDFGPTVYLPTEFFLAGNGAMNLEVRTYGAPVSMIRPVNDVLRRLDPQLAFSSALPLAEEVNNALWPERVLAILACTFGALAALIAGVGLYGMLSFSIIRQRRGIAIRLALGARAMRIAGLFLGHIARIVAAGLALGLVLYYAAGRVIQPLLYGISFADAFVCGSVAAFIIGVAATATVLPILRAIRIDPAQSLRAEDR